MNRRIVKTCLKCNRRFISHTGRQIYCGSKAKKTGCSHKMQKIFHKKAIDKWWSKNAEKENAKRLAKYYKLKNNL